MHQLRRAGQPSLIISEFYQNDSGKKLCAVGGRFAQRTDEVRPHQDRNLVELEAQEPRRLLGVQPGRVVSEAQESLLLRAHSFRRCRMPARAGCGILGFRFAVFRVTVFPEVSNCGPLP